VCKRGDHAKGKFDSRYSGVGNRYSGMVIGSWRMGHGVMVDDGG
jgi:hypothetical protein